MRLELEFRLNLLVAERTIVEIKSVDAFADVHYKQTLTYLRLADKRPGLLINFDSSILKGNARCVVNGLEE